MQGGEAQPYRMISIEVSQGCELARWLMQRVGLPFVEELHAPLLHVLATLRVCGGIEAPVIVARGTAWQTTTGIVDALDAHSPAGRKPYGETEEERLRNQAFLQSLLTAFGPATRRYVYHFVLPLRRVMVPLATYGVPAWERLFVTWLYPLWRVLLGRALGDTAPLIAQSPAMIESGLRLVEAELAARGTEFLSGEAPGGIDVIVAALMSPVIFPPEYGGILPALDDLPPVLRDFISACRASRAGRLTLDTYTRLRKHDAGIPPVAESG